MHNQEWHHPNNCLFLFSSIPVFENEQQDATAESMVGRCQEMREKGETGQPLENMHLVCAFFTSSDDIGEIQDKFC